MIKKQTILWALTEPILHYDFFSKSLKRRLWLYTLQAVHTIMISYSHFELRKQSILFLRLQEFCDTTGLNRSSEDGNLLLPTQMHQPTGESTCMHTGAWSAFHGRKAGHDYPMLCDKLHYNQSSSKPRLNWLKPSKSKLDSNSFRGLHFTVLGFLYSHALQGM